ncbi:MAG TPA: TonB-dependent receptor [Candidatus Saccharimonadales bacterium]|nr:TonB-dependent receptor [Candidatus Saccharimonadales bacterium]
MKERYASQVLHESGNGWSRLISRLLPLTMLTMLLCSMVFGQVTSGTISGTVKDPSGAVVQGAKIAAKSAAIGVTREVTANATGDFVLPNLPPGTYTITVEAVGFKNLESRGFILSVTDHLNVGTLTLQVGAASSEVTVAAEVGQIQLQADSGERSDLITGKQLNDIAMNGSNVLDYMKLIPGVSGMYDGHVSGTGGLSAININGTRANQHEFTLDGSSNVDTGDNGGTHVTINTDAIAEVKVLTSNYQAEFGKAAGGQIVLVSKGGTNEFHGNARISHRNEGMNANNYYANQNKTAIAKYRYNFAGYQVGGPVIVPGTSFNKNKDKLFFFWSQEYYQQLIPSADVTQFYTPTALERAGDFSQSVDGNGKPIVISSPYFTDNKINTAALSATQLNVFNQMKKMLALFPLPNVSGYGGASGQNYNYSTTLSYPDPRREDILRVDYQLSKNERFFGRWINNAESLKAPILPWPGLGTFACAGAINIQGGCTSKHPGWNLSLNLTSTLTPSILNELTIGPSVTRTTTDGVKGNLSTAANGIDLPMFYNIPGQSIPDLQFDGRANTNFGWSYLGATPWFQANTTINVNDNLTWVKQNHTMKVGAFYQRSRKDQVSWGNANGQLTFKGSNSGDPYSDALLGNFSSFKQSSARPTGYFRYNQLEMYVQDTWKLTPRLTLDYGMRFAWIPPQYDDKNQVAVFDPTAYIPANAVTIDGSTGNVITSDGGNTLNGMRYTNSNGNFPKGGWDDRGVMVEPRLGFAYDLTNDHKTILRGGFGMMHDRTQGNLIFNSVFSNPAVVKNPSVSNDSIANLPLLAADAAAGVSSQVLSGVYGAARNGKVPTVYSFSLGIQREIAKGTTLDVAYVGNLQRHLVTARDINAMPYGTLFTAAAQNPANYAGGVVPTVQPDLSPAYAAAGYNFDGRYAYNGNALVPFKGYGSIEYLGFNGTANYNALQASLQRRFGKGLTFGAVYTYSKSLTTANSDEDFQDPFNAKLDYRSASWDRTHVLALNYVYDLPAFSKKMNGPKWLGYVTDGFQFSGVTNIQTGTPIDTNMNWCCSSLTGSNLWGKTDMYYSVDKSGNPLPMKIGAPVRGSRDFFRTGGMQNWDLSLFKNFKFTEQTSLQLRLEGFNAFNHANLQNKNYGTSLGGSWDGPNGTYVSDGTISKNTGWGKYNTQYGGVGGPRVVQLGAKFYF